MMTRNAKTIAVAVGGLLLRKRISDMLSDMGHRTILAASGSEALTMVDRKTDLLILDIDIPDMSASALLESIRKISPVLRLPVIAVGTDDDSVRLEPLGVIDSINREGVHPEALAYKVNRALFSKEEAVDSRKRVPVSITTVFTVDGQSSTGILMNLSEGGAFLHTDQMLAKGAHIELTFYLENELIMARGIVKWSTPGAKGNLFTGSGITFTSLPWDSMQRISEFVRATLVVNGIQTRYAV